MRRLGLACVIGCFLAPCILLGQTSNASLGGTVSDVTGALLPGVEVSARNVGTGIANTAVTNETGVYHFPNLQTGTYEVSAGLPGFRAQQRNNVLLGVSQQVRLNFTLEVGDVATTIDVTEAADTALSTTSASIGTVLPQTQVSDLPLGGRNVMDLLAGMAGTGATDGTVDGYFAGNRLAATNVTRDGMTISTGRYEQGALSTTYMSPDLVEEVRVSTGTVDAEAGRGSGQVQMVTRSGTNQIRGSVFWNNRNSALSAANWFNNFNGVEGNFENRNQYGVRLGGPIIRNKTFFFFLIDNQRTLIKEDFVGTVLTNSARQGIYRFFPGADNRNAQQINPTVNLTGNPVRPAAATGDLQSINLFSHDPFRTGYDPSGYIQKVLLARMPSPNDFTVGDGLNTAGIRFTRRVNGVDVLLQDQTDQNNRDQINVRLDHNFSPSHKFSFVWTYENSKNESVPSGIEQWPNGYNGANRKYPRIYNFAFTSTLASKFVNELRGGYRSHDVRVWGPAYVGRKDHDNSTIEPKAKEALALMPTSNGIPLAVVPQIFTQGFMCFTCQGGFGSTRGSFSPLWQIGDTLSWISGRHAFKLGFEKRVDGTRGWNDNNFTPTVTLGQGNVIAPINSATITGLTSTNATTARNILYNLSGSIDNIRQGFDVTSSKPPIRFAGWQDGVVLKSRDWKTPEISAFFKDEWKVTQNLTLNLGMAWQWYGVPYEENGLAAKVIGGAAGLCGPACGGLTNVEFVGRNSTNPDRKLFDDDWNNFAPAAGFSYSIPGLGRSTILRGGYGISYAGRQISNAMSAGGLDSIAGTLPGAFGGFGCCGQTYTRTGYWDLTNTGVPFESQFEPLTPFPLTAPRTLTMNAYEPQRVSPYIQNFNLSLQRELAANLILDLSYVASKGTKLYGRLPLNQVKILETQFLEAFNVTRAGGNHPLFDRMLMGLNIPGAGRVNGTTITGSQALRLYTPTRADLANGEVGNVANFLTTSTNVTGDAGGFIRNGGLPEDFLVYNPQFQEVGIAGNVGNSTYHSLQAQLTKRFSHGLAGQVSYTWSKNLGISNDDHNVYGRDPNNFNADKSLLGFHRSHIVTGNGTYVLPFGTNGALLNAAPGWLNGLVGDWQLGFITRWTSGAPLTLIAGGLSNIWQQANNTPQIQGAFPDGAITFRDRALPTFFPGLTQATDPGRANVTPVNTLNAAYSLRAIFDASGAPLLVNPGPGEVGSLGIRTIEGPNRFQLDMNLNKRINVDESRQLEFRVDVTNVLNTPQFNNPNTDINSSSFGLISGAADGRRITLGARLNF
jgi:hypothetical protein